MGLKVACVVGAGGLGSLIAQRVTSKTCGSIVIVQGPILLMVSLGGFLGSSVAFFFRPGFVQYFSKSPSASHLCRDRLSDSARTPLRAKVSCVHSKATSKPAARSQSLWPYLS